MIYFFVICPKGTFYMLQEVDSVLAIYILMNINLPV